MFFIEFSQKLYEGFEFAIRMMRDDARFKETKICAVSRTYHADWAASCMRACEVDGVALAHIFDHEEIYPDDKKVHFRSIKKAFPSVAFSEMLFFDNEGRNTRSVAQLGVLSVLEPYGLTAEGFERALIQYAERAAAAAASDATS